MTSIGRAILLIQHAPTIAHTSLELSHSQFYITLPYYPEFYLLILSNQLFWKLPIAPPQKKTTTTTNICPKRSTCNPQTSRLRGRISDPSIATARCLESSCLPTENLLGAWINHSLRALKVSLPPKKCYQLADILWIYSDPSCH